MKKLKDKEWSELASFLSGEKTEKPDKYRNIIASGDKDIESEWKKIGKMKNEKDIDVDKAWSDLYTRLKEDENSNSHPIAGRITITGFSKIAAIALILLAIGAPGAYLANEGFFNRKITFHTGTDEKNLQVNLSDGSVVYLNYNTEFSCRKNFGRRERNVYLKGEAFFQISTDSRKPFTVDAGKAKVKVLGTSFNVITDNDLHEVEVFVENGKVALAGKTGTSNIVLEAGYIGKVNEKQAVKTINKNRNYRAWNTGRLVYEGEKLDRVFADMKKIFNIDIAAADPEILNKTIMADWDNDSPDTIIRVICTTFNLIYQKDGNVYHLTKK